MRPPGAVQPRATAGSALPRGPAQELSRGAAGAVQRRGQAGAGLSSGPAPPGLAGAGRPGGSSVPQRVVRGA
jgi:hypothetical protein